MVTSLCVVQPRSEYFQHTQIVWKRTGLALCKASFSCSFSFSFSFPPFSLLLPSPFLLSIPPPNWFPVGDPGVQSSQGVFPSAEGLQVTYDSQIFP